MNGANPNLPSRAMQHIVIFHIAVANKGQSNSASAVPAHTALNIVLRIVKHCLKQYVKHFLANRKRLSLYSGGQIDSDAENCTAAIENQFDRRCKHRGRQPQVEQHLRDVPDQAGPPGIDSHDGCQQHRR